MRLRQLLLSENVPEGSFHTRLHTMKDFDEIDPDPIQHLDTKDLEQHELMDVINKAPLHHIPISHPEFSEARGGHVEEDLLPSTRKYFRKGIESGNVPPAIGTVHGKNWKLNDGRHRASIAIKMGKTHIPVRMISQKHIDDKIKERTS